MHARTLRTLTIQIIETDFDDSGEMVDLFINGFHLGICNGVDQKHSRVLLCIHNT